jgi:hypothetical protein
MCKPFKKPRNRFPAWRNRFLRIDSWDSLIVYKFGLKAMFEAKIMERTTLYVVFVLPPFQRRGCRLCKDTFILWRAPYTHHRVPQDPRCHTCADITNITPPPPSPFQVISDDEKRGITDNFGNISRRLAVALVSF